MAGTVTLYLAAIWVRFSPRLTMWTRGVGEGSGLGVGEGEALGLAVGTGGAVGRSVGGASDAGGGDASTRPGSRLAAPKPSAAPMARTMSTPIKMSISRVAQPRRGVTSTSLTR